jgi:hypothetical protein
MQINSIGCILLTGGEPGLYPKAIRLIKDTIQIFKKPFDRFYVVTNGLRYHRKMIDELNSLYGLAEEQGECTLLISNDEFHKTWGASKKEVYDKYEENAEYFCGWKHRGKIIGEGRALETCVAEAEPPSYEFDVNIDDNGDIKVNDGVLYINALGDVIPDCDYSYESQKNFKIGNILDERLADILKRYEREHREEGQ